MARELRMSSATFPRSLFFLRVHQTPWLPTKNPLKKKDLQCLSFLDTISTTDEDYVMSRKLPNVVSFDNADNLRSEIRLFNLWMEKPSSHEWKYKVTEAWKWLEIRRRWRTKISLPLLLGRSFLNIVSRQCRFWKRNRLDDKRRTNRLFWRAHLRSRKLTCSSVQMETDMIE